jgi:hypothetical protein
MTAAALSQHQRRKRWWYIHLALFLVVNGFFVATWLMIRSQPDITDVQAREGFYPGWLLIVWGAVLGLHGVYIWARRPQLHPLAARSGGQAGRVVRTVLFTDIVGSTELAERLGDRRRHARHLRHPEHGAIGSMEAARNWASKTSRSGQGSTRERSS